MEFQPNQEYRQIINKNKDNQPSVQEIINVLEQIEGNEVQIKPYKIREQKWEQKQKYVQQTRTQP